MTDELLALARQKQHKAGVDNGEFLKGEIESIPRPDNSVEVNVIISNGAINLSGDKDCVSAGGVPGFEARRPLCRFRHRRAR
jgi:hypothetical protein